MNFVTIMQKNSDNPLIFHGRLLNKNNSSFQVSVINSEGLHEVWTCHYDYWKLIE